MKKIVIILLALLQLQVYGEKPILFIGATAHIGNGEVYENSIISVNNGVLKSLEMPLRLELIHQLLIQYIV